MASAGSMRAVRVQEAGQPLHRCFSGKTSQRDSG
jgi:hypothetical protein